MTQQLLSWTRNGRILRLSGELNKDVLSQLWNSRLQTMQGVTLIDLSAVIRIDTAGMALLVHLIEIGKQQGTRVTLTGGSDNVLTLAQLYNLPDHVLPR